MGRFTSSLLLGLSVLSYIQPSLQQGWVLVWRSGPDNSSVAKGNEPKPCTPINQTKGLEFSWDSHGGPWCIEFWHDSNCTSRAGWDCNPWPWVQDATQPAHGFSVYRNESAATSSASTSATATATPSSTASASSGAATTTAAESDGDGDDGLSGGAIAGIVVGVVAGVAIIAALAFFFGLRRRRQNKAIANGNGNGNTQDYNNAPPSSSVPPGNIEMDKPIPWAQSPVKEEQPYRYAPGSRLVELAGENPAAELSDHTRVVELESPTDVKRSVQS